MASHWMLYGANGYTGQLIAEEAVRRGMAPILAGRNHEAIETLATKLGLPFRVFPLTQPAAIARQLQDVDALLLAAGPFSRTSGPVLGACLRTGTHYLDITGEHAVIEACYYRNPEARRAGCVIMPAVGFDVVPTDCLALLLRNRLPTADALHLAFASHGPASRGTTRTAVEGLGRGGAARRHSKITTVPAAWRTRVVKFADKPRPCVSVPWGDIASAYYTTGIPNITCYMAAPRNLVFGLRASRFFGSALRFPALQALLERRLREISAGPTAAERKTTRAQIWGRAENGAGESVEATLTTENPYALTAKTALACLEGVFAGLPAGAHTPAGAFGPNLIRDATGAQVSMALVA